MIGALFKHVTWRAVLIAGVVAGTVFLITNLVLLPIALDIKPGLILRYFAGLVMGSDVLTDDGTDILVVGLLVHYALAILFAFPITIVVHRWGLSVGILGGAVLGLALYSINFYTLTNWVEWFFALKSTVLLFSHVLFGAVAGGVYELFDHYDQPILKEGAA